jgi:DnaJ family protein C protein 28
MSKVEDHINSAMQEGKFENLPGKGKPLRLDENPFENPEWRMANHVLRSNGFTLPWIETRNEIEGELEKARKALARAWIYRQSETSKNLPTHLREAEWQRAVDAFREQVTLLNKRVLKYNLEVPSIHLQLLLINSDRELDRLTASTLSDTL